MLLSMDNAERFANLALQCIHREYPTKLGQHVLNSDADVRPARELTPAFYGCYDWHSAVHGHWMLIRLARTFPDAPLAVRVKEAVGRSLNSANLQREAEYFQGKGRESFERPYGLAWLLQLAAELRAWNDPDGDQWSAALAPLAGLVEQRLRQWLGKLSHPVRSGEHSQSAFSFGLMLDYARACDRPEFAALLEEKIRRFYGGDRDGPLAYEPSGEDFLSPGLAEADVVRRVMRSSEFAEWLGYFLPQIPRDGSTWLRPAEVMDRSDPKLAHLDGLNLSRAWMLRGILNALPQDDARIPSLRAAANEHAAAGLASVGSEHYEGAHWLGTFAVYLLTETASAQY
jgi:Protein of unknown function (DUF2891)